jgi:hypothetical protein
LTLLPISRLVPAEGFDDLTTSGPSFSPFLAFGFVTFPTAQPAAFNADFACASALPASFGTMHTGVGAFACVYEISAEQAEVLWAASVAVAGKAAVTSSATSTEMPGEPSLSALSVASGAAAQFGPA